MQPFVLLFMTSRSGSSMVADIVVRHGFNWAANTKRNPVVGRKVTYRSFENQNVKGFMKEAFGMPLGDFVTFDDHHVNAFSALVRGEYVLEERNVWKGAVEFFPLWWRLHELGVIDARPMVILRNKREVIDSVLAKRGGGRPAQQRQAEEITDRRFDALERLAADYAFPVVLTSDIVKGDRSSLRDAFASIPYPFDEEIASAVIDASKWEADR
jgi:hypothetical protein